MKLDRSSRLLVVVVGQVVLSGTAIATNSPLWLVLPICAVYGWLAGLYLGNR